MRRAASFALVVALVGSAAQARGDENAGRTHFKNGTKLFDEGAYAAALVEFNAANDEAPSVFIHFAIGQTCAELKDYACAMHAFDMSLKGGRPQIKARDRATAKRELLRLAPYVSKVFITVNVEGAEVTVDAVRAGTSPIATPVLVNAGRHTFGATKSPLFPAQRAVDVPGGADHVDVSLDLVAPPAPPPTRILLLPAPVAAEKSRLPLWLGLGTTGVLAAVGTTFGILTLGAQSNLDDRAAQFGVTRDEIDRAQAKQNTFALVTDITLGAAIIAAGITTVILLVQR